MLQCSSFPHLKTTFFILNRNNHQHQYIPRHNLYKSSCQAVENQLLKNQLSLSSLLFATIPDFFSKPDLTRLWIPISQSKTIISYCPMIVHQIKGIACHKRSFQNQYSSKSKPRVLHQEVCVLYPMQCKYWNFLAMG